MSNASALCARGLCVELGGRRVLDAVDLSADFGQLLAVLGPNGAGKTSLLRALCGQLPFAGEVDLCGHAIAGLSARERSRLLAFVPQRSLFSARLRVRSIVSHGRYAHLGGLARLGARDEHAIDRAIDLTDLRELELRVLPELSHGEQRRVLLARALATEARVLVLDEPSAALDVAHALALYELLRRLAGEGYCVILALHQLDDALHFCDRALLLRAGRSIAFGDPAQVISEEHVRAVYGVRLVKGGALGFELLPDPEV